MPDYKLGKIYQIWSPNTDKVYIGSTVQPLHKRFDAHKRGLTGERYTNSRKVLECGEARIELIEDYPCARKSELNRREGQVMRGYDNRVNKCIAGRTRAEYRADNREVLAAKDTERHRRPEVKERKAAQDRERYRRPEVREHIAAQRREYRQRPEVKARHNGQSRDYYHRKKEHVLAKHKEYEQRPEVRERRNAQARERRQRKKEQQQTASA
jgi:hypothetical protein